MSIIVPAEDVAPSLTSRIVTIRVTDLPEGGVDGEPGTVTFVLPGDLRVPADDVIVRAGSVTVELDAFGQGQVRLPCHDPDAVADGGIGSDWYLLVKKSWSQQVDMIRVPAGTSPISLADITPVVEVTPEMGQWLLTNAGVEIIQGSVWGATVAVAGGVATFRFTVPPGGVAWQRGSLATTADALRMQEHEGMYRLASNSNASTAGMPEALAGTLWVEWSRGATSTSAIARQTYQPDIDVARRWQRVSTSTGWTQWERVDPRHVRAVNAGGTIDDLRLENHSGTWRIADSSTGDSVTGWPAALAGGSRGGTLWVEWIRGVNATSSVARQTARAESGKQFERMSSSAGWTPWKEIAAGGGAPVTDGTVTHVHVIPALGQSNMSGRGTPFGPEFGDAPDARIWEYGATLGALRVAEVPLDMHDAPMATAGLSPATVFAREWVRKAAPGTVVLLVPAAHSGTGFNTGTWNWSDESGEWSLTAAALAQTAAAVSAAQSKWPGATVTVRAILWHQGENSGGVASAEDYIAKFATLVGRFRAVYPDVPVVLGEVSPDRPGGVAGTNSGLGHQDIPHSVARTALAHALPNQSREGDLAHFGREGIEQLGKAMHAAYPAAAAASDATLVMPPPRVRAWRDGQIVELDWDAPLCRTTAPFVVEASSDGGASWTSDGITVVGRRAFITDTTSGVTHVRVASVGVGATSRFTHPVAV